MNNGPNRIDPTPVRLSTNFSIDRQTPKTDFGDRLNAGINNAAGAVANGAAIAAPLVPGGAIISAAVSSSGSLTNSGSAGQSVSGQYSAAPMGSLNTTVGSVGSNVVGATSLPTGAGSGVGGVGGAMNPASTGYVGSQIGNFQQHMQEGAAQNAALMQVQIQMQQENQVFSTVSNVLKVRHDTVKNTIQNVH